MSFKARYTRREALNHQKEQEALKQIFDIWRLITLKKVEFKAKLQHFLRTRATNLLSLTICSWKAFTAERQILKKLQKIAAYFFLEKKLKFVINALKHHARIKRTGRQIHSKHLKSKRTIAFNIWKLSFLQGAIVDKVLKQKGKAKLRQCFKNWRELSKYKEQCKWLADKIQEKKKSELLSITFSSWCVYAARKLKAKLQSNNMQKDYDSLLQTKVFRAWRHYTANRNETNRLVQLIQTKRSLQLAHQFFIALFFKTVQRREVFVRIRPFFQKRI